MPKVSNLKGFTLIEVIFSLFVISVAVLAVVFGFLGITRLVGETKKVVEIDKDIAGAVEMLRGTEYDAIEYAETPIEIEIIDPSHPSSFSTTSVNLKMVTLSSSWDSLFFKQTKRKIKFYIYEKGINYRP